MSVLLNRHATLETVSIEALSGMGEQGEPTYGTSVDVEGRVVLEDSVARNAAGEEVKSFASVWIGSAQEIFPGEGDRVTVSGLVGIVVEREEGRTLKNVVDHVMVKLREE